MVYRGRVVVDLAAGRKLAAGYILEVRSWDNKKRKMYPRGNRLYVGPLVEGSEPTVANADLIFYDTMLVNDSVLVVTNGQQTDARTYREKVDKPSLEDSFSLATPSVSAERIMGAWGYEADPSNTPRIALIKTLTGSTFAIAARHPESDLSVPAAIDFFLGQKGKGLSTYTGRSDSADSWRIRNSGELGACLFDVPVTGESPEALADALYEFADPNHVVLTAAAVFERGTGWRVAFKNRYQTEADWLADRAEREKK